jgi:hypothetical protein
MAHNKGEEDMETIKLLFILGWRDEENQGRNGEIIFVQINAFDHSLIFQILFKAHSKKNIKFERFRYRTLSDEVIIGVTALLHVNNIKEVHNI